MENHTTSGLRTLDSQFNWYVGRVLGGRERLFERLLRRFGIQTYVPVATRFIPYEQRDDCDRILRRGIKEREVPLFPGYVFAHLNDHGWARTKTIEVARKPQWLDFGYGPVQIPAELIESIQARERNGFVRLAEPYREGEELEVMEPGAWYGRRGVLASDPERRILALHMIAETSAVLVVRFDREQVRRAL